MTASTKPKTPSMSIPVRAGIPRPSIEAFCKKASRLTLSQIVDKVEVKERLVVNGLSRSKEYTVQLDFFPEAEYRAEHDATPLEILSAFSAAFPLLFKKEVLAEMKKLDADLKTQMNEVGKGRAESTDGARAAGGGDDDAGEDEGRARRRDEERSELGDGDAEDEKRARQSRQQATYESDDDGELADEDEELDEGAALEAAYADTAPADDAMDEDGVAKPKKKGVTLKARAEAVGQSMMEIFTPVTSFAFTGDGCTISLEVCVLLFVFI
jgi:hypothetical protein